MSLIDRLLNFAESKIVAYHGSLKPVAAFSSSHTSINSWAMGSYDVKRTGIFFASKPEDAKQYGPHVQRYELDLRKIANLDNGDLIAQFRDSIDAFDDREMWLSAKYAAETWMFFDGERGERFVSWLKSRGFDSATFLEDAGKTYVLFDPKAIKTIAGKE